ncbi:hypothetical protein MMC11_005209 [Xylographa trunciseda]|nr:hypothetical protein [Xylographa trunciseda]
MAAVNAVSQNRSIRGSSAVRPAQAFPTIHSELHQSSLPYQSATTLPISSPATSSTSSRRHPTRQAASGAHYNLSATWSSFTEYLTESGNSGSDGGRDESSSRLKIRRPNGSDVPSEDESDSDEYINQVTDERKMARRRVGTKGVDDRDKQRRKKRRVGRLGRADLEVIYGEKPARRGAGGKKARKAHGAKLDGLTKKEAGRLVEYLLWKTDWVDAAKHIHGTALVKSEGVKAEPIEERLKKPSDQTAQITRQSIGPDQLRMHWTETLSKRLVDLYVD